MNEGVKYICNATCALIYMMWYITFCNILTSWPLRDAEVIYKCIFKLILRIDILSSSYEIVLGEYQWSVVVG